MKKAALVLNGLPNVGPISYQKLKSFFKGDMERIFQADEYTLSKIEGLNKKVINSILHWQEYFNLAQEENWLNKKPAEFIDFDHQNYPELLKSIYDPPIGLYFCGNYRSQKRTVAIVGTRQPTLYGSKIAQTLAIELSRAGFCIASGFARGIDTIVHESVLSVDGTTIGILGCGLNIIYPSENKNLYDRIVKSEGAIITESAFGRHVDRLSFPRRNRIISGISEAVIVIESGKRGGSILTANFAADQGRVVCAVPGRIDQESSAGCHDLIKDGAVLVTCVDDILQEINDSKNQTQIQSSIKKEFRKLQENESLEPEELRVWKFVTESGNSGIDLISESLKMSPQDVNSIVLMLELKRCLIRRIDGTFEAVG